MKTVFVILLFTCMISASPSLLASYYDFDEDSGCGNGSCEYCTTCQCTDLGAGKNYCMSLSKYCEAFGNIGAR
jgi:hypothetical protein